MRPWNRFLVAVGLCGLGALMGVVVTARGSWTDTFDHLKVHRLDVIDSKGVVRVTLGAPVPDPIVGGKSYRRAFAASGLTVYDENGNEKGGIGVADIPGSMPVLALDYPNMDATGFRVMPDGSVSLLMNERPPITHDAAGKVEPARKAVTRMSVGVAPDGTPQIELADKQGHPRVRITVSAEGYGEIAFLDAQGKVVSTIIPEHATK